MAEVYKIGCPKSEAVKKIQRALNLIPDGVFGKLTDEAVREWQKENGLVADGIVGPATLSKMFPAVERPKKSRRIITHLVVHCTASREGQPLTVEQIRANHMAPVSKGGRGWADIGYHYVILLDGTIAPGRDVDKIGAHVTGYNSHSIGIVYVGGLDKNGKAKDTRTPEQKEALVCLLKMLRQLYPTAKICGHRDFSPDKNGNGVVDPWERIKECPCFEAKEEYKGI
jgi:hypothetical protein